MQLLSLTNVKTHLYQVINLKLERVLINNK